ncbi:MAG: Crp/Fnr family transcriptional regulator, partial [Polyangia bacterium]
MAQDEKRALWYIKKIPLFQDVSHDTIHKLVQCVELKEVRRRQVVYLPGDPGQAVYFVNGGRVKISKVTRDGKELTLAYRGPGEIFGELVMIDGGPREEMAEAMENALITEIDRAEFEKIVQKEGIIGFR